jgi:hypothetical protein
MGIFMSTMQCGVLLLELLSLTFPRTWLIGVRRPKAFVLTFDFVLVLKDVSKFVQV